MCLLMKKLVDLNNIQGQCRMNIQDEDTFAGIVLRYLYKASDSQAFSNSSSSEETRNCPQKDF